MQLYHHNTRDLRDLRLLDEQDFCSSNIYFVQFQYPQTLKFLYIYINTSASQIICNNMHPIHIKKSIVYIQGLRIKRLCSSPLAFEKDLESIRSWFGNVATPRKLLTINLER